MNSARGAVDKLVRARLLRAGACAQSSHYSGKLVSHEERLVPYRGLCNEQGEAWTSFPFSCSVFCACLFLDTVQSFQGILVMENLTLKLVVAGSGIVGFFTESLLCRFQWENYA